MNRRIWLSTYLLCACFVLLPAQKPKGMKPGVERWPIKTTAHHMNEAPRVIAFDSLIALPDPAGVKKNDSRFQDAFIPSFHNFAGLHEGEIVRVSGWLHLIAYETDGDYHIQISNSETSGDHCLIVEVPYPTYVKSAPNLKKLCAAVRSYIKKKILANKEPGTSGTVLKKAVYVTVTGQLFYDDSHVGDAPRGKRGMHAATLWELHPVTGLQVASMPGQ
jgi:hypothetical protein